MKNILSKKRSPLCLILIMLVAFSLFFRVTAYAEEFLWVANAGSNTVSKIDAVNNTVTATIDTGDYPVAVAVSKSHVFVANRDSKTISVIGKDSDEVETVIPLEHHPLALSLGAGGYLHAVTALNTISYTSSNMAYLDKINVDSLEVIKELPLRTISNLDIGIGVSASNLAYIPYEFSWSMNTGVMIVDLDDYTLKGTYTHSPTTYGYIGPGITIDKDGNGWVSGLRLGNERSIIKITPSGEQQYYRDHEVGSLSELVTDDQGNIWSAPSAHSLAKVTLPDGAVSVYDLSTAKGDLILGKGLSFADGHLWLVDTTNSLVHKVNPQTGEKVAEVAVGTDPLSFGDLSGYEADKENLNVSLAEVVPLPFSTPMTGNFPQAGEKHFYKLQFSAAGFVKVTIEDTDKAGINNLYGKCKTLPNSSRYDFAGLNSGSADQEMLVSSTTAQSCYILVQSSARSEEYTITATPVSFGVISSTPGYYGNTNNAEITISGTGFSADTIVSLIDNDGHEYTAASQQIDSPQQITARFDFSSVPVGVYHIKVKGAGGESILNKNFEIFETKKANLETHLILPGSFGRHATSTIYIEYKNTGNVAMPAPMLRLVSTDEDDSDKPILTLDSSRIIQGYWSTVMPPGCGHSVLFLADGDDEDSPGVLQPGESGRMPVYYLGLLQPWDFSDNRVELQIRIINGDDPTPYGWEELKADIQPDFIPNAAWDIIYENLAARTGETWGDYITSLAANAAYLYRHGGEKIRDRKLLMKFEMLQALGYGPVPALADSLDISVDTPGLPLHFARRYPNSIITRHTPGPLGTGWNHNWQLAVEEREDGTVLLKAADKRLLYTPDIRGGYQSPAGNTTRLIKEEGLFSLLLSSGIKYSFNASGLIGAAEDQNGNRITAEYAGTLLTGLHHSCGKSLALHYNGDRIVSISDGSDKTVQYAYTEDMLVGATDIRGFSTSYGYEVSGKGIGGLQQTVFPDGTTESFTYDEKGRLGTISNNGNPVLTLEYGDAGEVLLTSPADGASTTWYYNHIGKFIKYTDAYNLSTLLRYDSNYNLASIIMPDGTTAGYGYDPNGNLSRYTDQNQATTTFRYNGMNRLTAFTNALEQDTAYRYDTRGNNIARISPDASEIQYEYDSTGNITSWTNRRGETIRINHDTEGRITGWRLADGSSVAYQYNSFGDIISVTDTSGITTLDYTANHLLRRISYPEGRFLEYSYDDAGRRISMTDQSGYIIRYSYNDAGLLEAVTDNNGITLARYSYDALQRLTLRQTGNGVRSSYSYDLSGRLVSLQTTAADGSLISSYSYQYDANSRRTEMETRDGKWSYRYDNAGQLTAAEFTSTNPEVPSQSIEYRYDALGNRSSEIINGTTVQYTSNELNQYVTHGGYHYKYDKDGNLTEKSDGITTWKFTYNSANQLIRSSGPDGINEYRYNGLGHLVQRIENGVVYQQVIDPVGYGNMVGEYNALGEQTARYIYGHGLVAADNSYYSFDGNGNTSELTNGAGEIVNFYIYRPFGKPIKKEESRKNPFQFAGQLGIQSSGNDLLYMRNRFYAMETGRFISEDPIGLAGGDISFYRYVGNDPVNWVDPWGLLTTAQNFAIGAAGTTASMASMASGVLAPFAPAIGGLTAAGLTMAAGGTWSEAAWNGLTAAFGGPLFNFALKGSAGVQGLIMAGAGDFMLDLIWADQPPPWEENDPCSKSD